MLIFIVFFVVKIRKYYKKKDVFEQKVLMSKEVIKKRYSNENIYI